MQFLCSQQMLRSCILTCQTENHSWTVTTVRTLPRSLLINVTLKEWRRTVELGGHSLKCRFSDSTSQNLHCQTYKTQLQSAFTGKHELISWNEASFGQPRTLTACFLCEHVLGEPQTSSCRAQIISTLRISCISKQTLCSSQKLPYIFIVFAFHNYPAEN